MNPKKRIALFAETALEHMEHTGLNKVPEDHTGAHKPKEATPEGAASVREVVCRGSLQIF
jgi:hypothetical protein